MNGKLFYIVSLGNFYLWFDRYIGSHSYTKYNWNEIKKMYSYSKFHDSLKMHLMPSYSMLCLKQLDLALGRGGRNLLKPSESSQRNGVSLFLYHPGHWHTNNIILTHFVLKCSVSPYACCVTCHLLHPCKLALVQRKDAGSPKKDVEEFK